MKITCLSVGKRHDRDIAQAIQKYQTRLSAYCDFSFEFIPNSNINKESIDLIKRLKTDDFVILLDEKGQQLDNTNLIDLIRAHPANRYKRLVFIIGGAFGVDDALINRCDILLSISKLVFPHQLMRLILVEQLYRSFNIMQGGNYHHS